MQLVTPELGLIVWMLISFGIMFGILKAFAWKPILKALKDRELSIEDALKSAERAKEEMGKLQADNQRILDEAKAERDLLLSDARDIKDQIIADAKAKANSEAIKLIAQAHEAIQTEKMAAVNEMKTTIANLSVNIAEKLLRANLADEKSSKELIDRLLQDMNLN